LWYVRLLLADDCLQNIAGLGNVREIDLGLDSVRFRTAGTRRRTGLLRIAGTAKIASYFVRFMLFNRTGMRLFLGDTHRCKSVKNSSAFNFQISG
jgi:hypothetical protein